MQALVEMADGSQRVINTALVRQFIPAENPEQTVLEFDVDDYVIVNLPLERFVTKLNAFHILPK